MAKCPVMNDHCLSDGCAWWLRHDEKNGRCAVAWIAIKLGDIETSIDQKK